MPRKKGHADTTASGGDRSGAGAEARNEKGFPVVGIGSSAGGLEALQELFRAMPVDTGMAFVVVSHQHPGHESLLPELLRRETDLPMILIEDGMRVEPDHVYVLGPGQDVTMEAGALVLRARATTMGKDMPIDVFFRSLAADMHERAVCIVLSGTGSDGTIGTREIKAHGGMAMAQQPPSARYAGMPTSAGSTGMVDFVERPSRMPERLINYAKGPYLRPRKKRGHADLFPDDTLKSILRYLRSRLGHDFSAYKSSTIRRRIERRMSVHGIEHAREYLDLLHQNPSETRMLFSELLISVTSFFRDPEAFSALQNKYLPELITSRPENHELRAWVAGCATGEEAYSIAMVLAETTQRLHKPMDIRVFGTDLDDRAIERARRGVYPASISVDVSPERLEYFFNRDGDNAYQVRKEIRDMLIFAPQNMLSDPPFTKLDLLVCRNVLIYLQSDLQKLLLPTFHYALKPGGLLFLGSSESVGTHSELFESLDSRWKIYRRKEGPTELRHLPVKTDAADRKALERTEAPKAGSQPHINRLIERFLIKRFAPTSLVIDRKGTIVYIHGRTGAYLEPEQQQPRNNVFEMAREGLSLPLSSAVRQARNKEREITHEQVRVKTNGEHITIDLRVSPIRDPEGLRGLLLVTITPHKPTAPRPPAETRGAREQEVRPERVSELERELMHARESHQTMIEELQSSNEEMQSSNEELQSTNEELQSSKEEMESLNEELSTVNNELNSKVEQLGQARDDMSNLLNSIDLGVIFLDRQLRIKRYTEKVKSLINLREGDIGRPISDLAARVNYRELIDDCREVLARLGRKEKEVSAQDGTWQLVRILPYRTSENMIGGVVLTFVDITRLKEAERQVQALEYFQSIVQTVSEPLIVLDSDLRVQTVNDAFLRTFALRGEELHDKRIYEIGEGEWDIPRLRELLERILPQNASFSGFEVEHDFPRIGRKKFLLNARRLQRADGMPELMLLVMKEVMIDDR